MVKDQCSVRNPPNTKGMTHTTALAVNKYLVFSIGGHVIGILNNQKMKKPKNALVVVPLPPIPFGISL